MEGLASRGYRVFAGDHRGQGTNAVKRGHLDITLTGMTADAMSVIDGLGLRKPHVVGQGLGGLVALALAAWRPDLIASATAIAASAEADDHRETSASILDDLRGCRLPVLALSGAGERPTPHHISGAAVAAVPGGRQVTNVALGQLDVLIEHLEEQFAIADHASGDATDG
ncbi:alpha/beta hydrolase [Nocardia otitidiscaviarum]|nr:alpha/beta fold hydrolase [Nocardia otitidiscaviarum]